MRRGIKGTLAAGALIVALALPASATAQVQPYGTNDFGGFLNILPPGEGKNVTGPEFVSYTNNGAEPAHFDDQRLMYGNLVYATPGISAGQLGQFYKDGTFGVRSGDVASTISPRPGATILRDAGFGVPHVYGATRADVMFGAGYAGAQDRLFFMDVLRHSGRAQLSEFLGGSNKSMDAQQWDVAPYTEADLQRQYELADDLYGDEGAQLQSDVNQYVAGINQYISEARLNAAKMPIEYSLLGHPTGPTDWKVTDVIATASLVGGILGKGGGGELTNAQVYEAARARFGKVKGLKVWKDFRRANDPEAPTTAKRAFPYQDSREINKKAVALPDAGSLVPGSPDDASASLTTASAAAARSRDAQPSSENRLPPGGVLGGLQTKTAGSNGLMVSANESKSGHPLAVFGPQVGYFAPQILMEEDLHGPDIDARGAAFAGVNLFVLLGRGQDYAWSATSAGQDIIDTFAERLCEPGGGTPTVNSMFYLWRGRCLPIETLDRTEQITPNFADPTPAQTFHLQAQRTLHGIVSERGTVNGKPVAFVRQRSTYMHEADSALGFSRFNTPSLVTNYRDFQNAANKIGFTFNWLYTDDRDIAYFNSGYNPVRARGTTPEFPNWGTGKFDWRGWNPDLNTESLTPFRAHPQAVNQQFITSWNNKQAPQFRAAESNYGFGSIYRVQLLDQGVKARIKGRQKIDLPGMVDAMEDAGTVDLRGNAVLPWMLKVLGRGGVPADLRGQVATLSGWISRGAHRRDADRSGNYDDAAAVQLMDAWWPLVLQGIYQPKLGDDLYNKLQAAIHFDDPPGPLGSAYQEGWYGYVQKDLRTLLGRNVEGPYSRSYCGSGGTEKKRLATCKRILADTLRAATQVPSTQLYPKGVNCSLGDAQVCHDVVRFAVSGAVGVKEIPWINRPTWQQAVEILGHRGRGPTIAQRKCKVKKKKGGCPKKKGGGKSPPKKK